MNQQQQFEFRYKGENFIDLNTLITSQFHFLAAVNELQKELYPDVDLKLKVGAFNKGSFVVDLLLETNWVDHLFNKDSVYVLEAIVGGFASIVGIHKYLKGRKADKVEEKGDNVTISVNGDKNSVTVDKRVFNIYKDNVTINKSVQQNFEMLQEDDEIEGVEIKVSNASNDILTVEREEFQELAKQNPYLSRTTMEEVHLSQNLFIKKPNLMPEKNKTWKWELIHKGRDISAKVVDWDFALKINEGLKIGQGDRLVADLRIGYKYSEQFGTFVERNFYEVVKVHKLIPRSEQTRIDY